MAGPGAKGSTVHEIRIRERRVGRSGAAGVYCRNLVNDSDGDRLSGYSDLPITFS